MSTSFGELSSTDTHICKRQKIQVNTKKNAQKINSETCHLQRGPTSQSKRGTKANAPHNPDKGPHVRLPEKDKDELLPGGIGQP